MDDEPAEPHAWVLTTFDDALILGQWLQIELVLGAHAVELRGTLTPDARWTWIPQGVPVPARPEHNDWRRAIEEGDSTQCEIEAHAHRRLLVAELALGNGDDLRRERTHGALARPGESVFLLRDPRRAEALRRALRGIGEPSTAHADDRRSKLLALVLGILRADEPRLAQLAERLTSEEVAALRTLALNENRKHRR